MMLLGKESTEQKQENIRSYVYILRENVFFMTGTGPWHTHPLWTLLTMNIYFPKFAKDVFKSEESKIDSRVSFMFRKIYEHFYELVQQYRKCQ